MFKRVFEKIFFYLLMLHRKVKDRFNPCFYSARYRLGRVIEGKKVFESKATAIFVIYRKHGVPFYIKNILDQFERLNVSCWVSINDDASEEIVEYLADRVCGVVLRKNFGHDFAAYKDLLNLVGLRNCERLIMLNDSAFYFSRDLDKLFDQLVNTKYEVLPLTASAQYGWHAQSYLVSISSRVFNHQSFLSFWKNYKPYNSRRHAIFNGEIKLSREVFSLFDFGPPVYSKLIAVNSIVHSSNSENLISLLPDVAQEQVSIDGPGNNRLISAFRKVDCFNPSHGIPMVCAMELGFCVLKKDVFFRGTFSMLALVQALVELGLDNSEIVGAISEIERRGSFDELDWFGKLSVSL
jgi:hypothetical protein